MLMEVRGFAQAVADAIASVIGVEVGMVDEHLLIVVGSGKYARNIGRVLPKDTVSAQVMLGGQTMVIANPPVDDLCRACLQKDTCTDAADIISPLVIDGKTAGCVLLVACTPEQKATLIGETQRWVDFLEKMTQLIARAFNERQKTETMAALARQYDTVINSVQEGILALDDYGTINQANQAAARLLRVAGDYLISRPITDVFPQIDADLLRASETTELETFSNVGGRRVYWLGRINPIAGKGSPPHGYVLTFRGIEEIPRLVASYMRSERPFTFEDILGSSPVVLEAKRVARSIAGGDSTVLIQGESGTGKELFARAIHFESPRRKGSFVAVNCAAIPEAILESELFGYEEGAFTGAKRGGKPGKFELAQDGTLFLDEIGDMPLHLQAKLLRAIEERQVDRLGGRQPVPVNIRVIAATNKDLRRLALSGEFRLDLYYRLAVIPISIPPLREHKADIPEYAAHFIRKYAPALGKRVEGVAPGVLKALTEYSWPGNIRELANALEYAVNLVKEPLIGVDSLPGSVARTESAGFPVLESRPAGQASFGRRAIAREELKAMLDKFGTSTRAKEAMAAALGISRATLYRKLKEYDLYQ
jgi:transcriptional regulator with PAS, ATPase and Fis domain